MLKDSMGTSKSYLVYLFRSYLEVAVDLVHLQVNVGEGKLIEIQWASFPIFHVFTSSASLMNSIALEFQTIKWN